MIDNITEKFSMITDNGLLSSVSHLTPSNNNEQIDVTKDGTSAEIW